MSILKNDPKLTAFVLNELSESERRKVAEAIKNNPELQAEVALLQSTLSQFKKLKTTEIHRLDPARREQIFSQIQPVSVWSRYVKLAGGLAVASLAVVIYIKNENSLHMAANKSQKMNAEPAASEAPPVKLEKNSDTAMKVAPAAPLKQKEQDLLEPQAPAGDIADAPAAPADAAALTGDGGGAADYETRAPGPETAKEKMEQKLSAQAASRSTHAFSYNPPATAGGAGGGMAANAISARSKATSLSKSEVSPEIPSSVISTDFYSFEVVKLGSENPMMAAALLRPLFSCFESSLSRYANYHVEVTIYWKPDNTELGRITEYGSNLNVMAGQQKFDEEYKCLEPKLRSELKSNINLYSLRGDQRIRLILRSK